MQTRAETQRGAQGMGTVGRGAEQRSTVGGGHTPMDMCDLGLSPSPGRPFVLGEAGMAAGVPDGSLQTLKVCKHGKH